MQTDWLHNSSSQKNGLRKHLGSFFFFFAMLCLLTRSIDFLTATMTMFLHQELKALRWGWGQAWEIYNSPKPQMKQVFHWKSYPQVSTFPLSCLFYDRFLPSPYQQEMSLLLSLVAMARELPPSQPKKKKRVSSDFSSPLKQEMNCPLKMCTVTLGVSQLQIKDQKQPPNWGLLQTQTWNRKVLTKARLWLVFCPGATLDWSLGH